MAVIKKLDKEACCKALQLHLFDFVRKNRLHELWGISTGFLKSFDHPHDRGRM